LYRRIAEIEGRPAGMEVLDPLALSPAGSPSNRVSMRLFPRRGAAQVPIGIPTLDSLLAGGLRRDALHEVRAETTRAASAATGFAVAILARLADADDRPVLWVTEEAAVREGGQPHGPGLDRFGLASHRLIIVVTRRPEETLWVFEEGLRCAGLAAVLAEIRGHPRVLDLTASRRLALRARDGRVMGLLLRQAAMAEPGAAATRWLVAPQPAATLDDFAAGIGRPVWRLHLERNRAGPTGRFDLEWDHGTRSFALAQPVAPALSRPRASLSFDRPHLAGAAGTVVAHRRAG
jgi:protein ImuA